jgi:hypothetical protein
MGSFLVETDGKRLCQFPTRGLDSAGIVLEATPEEETPARLLILGARLLGEGDFESSTWFHDVLTAGTELRVTSVTSDRGDPPQETVRSDSGEGAVRKHDLQQAFAEMEAGTRAPRSIPIPLPWQTLAFRVMVNDELLCHAEVTEEQPMMSLQAVWKAQNPGSLWLFASSSPQGWPPRLDASHRWLNQHIMLDQQVRIAIIGRKPGIKRDISRGAV